MAQVFGWISAVFSVLCYLPYIRDILLKKTKPERASWFIWSILGAVAYFSQLAKGATDSLWLTGVQMLGASIIYFLSLRHGTGGLAKKDILALCVAFIGIVLWGITKEAVIALMLVIIVDGAGSVLTIIKSYEDPGSETLITWILSGTSGLFGALAVGRIDIVLLMYPLYILLINYMTAGSMLLGFRKAAK